jgi:hypothetical protein
MPVQENHINRITSYQSGTLDDPWLRCCKSVNMYGAFGKKINHKKAKVGIATYNTGFRQEKI